MPLETVIGPKRDLLGIESLLEILRGQPWNGTLYVGYPVVALPDGPAVIDAFLTSEEHGLVIFHLPGAAELSSHDAVGERQDELYRALLSSLLVRKDLVAGRALNVPLNIVSVVPPTFPVDEEASIVGLDRVVDIVRSFPPIPDGLLPRVNSALQSMGGIRVTMKRNVVKQGSRGAVIRTIEEQIANLDQWQKAAAIETPDGPQRIRGLAGSGKTVVLALKAAYLHARQPSWNIALTFETRSLYQQLRKLVTRFFYEQTRHEPDWNRLKILHAWGAKDQPGFYRTVTHHCGLRFHDVNTAKATFGNDRLFEAVCRAAVGDLKDKPECSLFDVVLIDEAQDLPVPFFEMAYLVTAPPKRIVWAYDELQTIGDYRIAPSSKLFGKHASGSARVPSLRNEEGQPKQDIILPVCYRNTPWALTTAHALGFGVYRSKGGLVQFFDDPELWHDIGYVPREGEIAPGKYVALARDPKSSPQYFEQLLSRTDAVSSYVFDDAQSQAEWVASQIATNLTADELLHRDIVVVVLPLGKAMSRAMPLIKELKKRNIDSHVVGETSSRDAVFSEGRPSVAIASLRFAKGNEAPMIYVIHAEYGIQAWDDIRGRNALFAALTRARAWVRVCGCGENMKELQKEIECVRSNDYQLRLTVPTADELRRMRNIHRDMSRDQRARVKTAKQGISAFLDLADEDVGLLETLFESLSREERERLLGALRTGFKAGDSAASDHSE